MGRCEPEGRTGGAGERCRPGVRRALHRVACAVSSVTIAIACGCLVAAEFVGEEPLAVRNAIGDGIHAYNAGDYDRAYDELTNAIEAGTDDPRGYYYRGLAALRLGRTSEAEADFTTGADRELTTGSMRRVSQSLERVQGPDRLSLERFRARARLGSLQREREAHGRRYSTIEDATGDVRRRRRPEDIRPELVAPRGMPVGELPPAAAGVEEVPAPAVKQAAPAKPGKTFEDEPAAESDDPFGDEPTSRKGGSQDKAAEQEPEEEAPEAEAEDAAVERDAPDEVEASAAQ